MVVLKTTNYINDIYKLFGNFLISAAMGGALVREGHFKWAFNRSCDIDDMRHLCS